MEKQLRLTVLTTRDRKHVLALSSAPYPPEIVFGALLAQIRDPDAPRVEVLIEVAPEEVLQDLERHAKTCEDRKCPHWQVTDAPKPGKLAPELRARGESATIPDIHGNMRGLLELLSGELESREGR